MRQASKRHRIVTVLPERMTALEPAIAHDFLGVDRSFLGVDWYRYRVCGVEPTSNIGGVHHTLKAGLGAIKHADTIVLPGWPTTEPVPVALTRAVQSAHRRQTRLVSFCTGAIVLAEAGVLDGRPATTHWALAPHFARQYPDVLLNPSVLYVDDGQILTSAGSAAAIDLSLHLIRLDFGADIANAVARSMVVATHREGGQAQYIEGPIKPAPADSDQDRLAATISWALNHLHEHLTVERLAAHALIGERHFSRLFRARTGTTPHRWILAERTLLARRLLETSDASIEDVAQRTGFASTGSLRLHFQRDLRTSPSAYRRAFQHQQQPT